MSKRQRRRVPLQLAASDLEGLRVIVRRTLPTVDDEGNEIVLQPGDEAPAWLLERSPGRLMRRGYIQAELLPQRERGGGLDYVEPPPAFGADVAPAVPAEVPVVDESNKKAEIIAALEALGVDVPPGLTKAELLELYEANAGA